MKLITRILLILAAGLLVAATLFGLSQSPTMSQLIEAKAHEDHGERGALPEQTVEGSHEEGEGNFASRPGRGMRGRPEGESGEGGGHGNWEPSLAGFTNVGVTLLKIGAIIAIFALVTRLWKMRQRKQPAAGGSA
ncbi:hypothetical protein EYB53_005800 [Candidatus Chloroploca sp. M-50]|uniref:Uncharacterized protein n=1 Tax=Candidatus Chloroploca mongolica TaxID=2528176 RepID=A0ABS4D726_9CHLR|nr:hypothetical protein [Candidatus Chloroploca mongolica]MBP1465215.1 hypothetical protein [Candidatus Chloroploca mongolica]